MKTAIEKRDLPGIQVLSRHSACSVFVQGTVEQVFAYIDDHKRFSSHMGQPSWKMGGGNMEITMDADAGQRVGSRIRLAGRVLGMALWVDEIVVVREPPRQKVWETTGSPRLLVIGHYRMGFTVAPHGTGSQLRVFIDYDLPDSAPARLLGRLLGKYYADWCTGQLALDTKKNFDHSARQNCSNSAAGNGRL